jgi:hypothetical protein
MRLGFDQQIANIHLQEGGQPPCHGNFVGNRPGGKKINVLENAVQ